MNAAFLTAGADRMLVPDWVARANGLGDDDWLEASGARQKLAGARGDDTLIANAARNTLTGRRGDDMFVIGPETKRVRLQDFEAAHPSRDHGNNTIVFTEAFVAEDGREIVDAETLLDLPRVNAKGRTVLEGEDLTLVFVRGGQSLDADNFVFDLG